MESGRTVTSSQSLLHIKREKLGVRMESGKEVTLFTERVIIADKGIETEVRMESGRTESYCRRGARYRS